MTSLQTTLSDFLKAIPNPFARSNPDLIVLRTTLTLTEDRPKIVFDLTGYGEISEQGRRTWRLALDEIGVSEHLSPDQVHDSGVLSLPLQLHDGLKAGLALMNPAADLPLWLDLVRPYGFLGILPWERVLSEQLARPVLRLPDFLVRPRENADVLEAAILFDPPPSIARANAVDQLKLIVGELLAGSPRAQTRIHIFPNAACAKALANPSVKLDKRAHVHSASEIAESAAEGLGFVSPWFDWICAALKGQSLDAVHFVCRARATEGAAVLLLSRSPNAAEAQILTAAEIGDLGAGLARLGAWAAMFSPPPGEADRAAMAFVADTLAQSRPGSVAFHPAAPDCAQHLRETFRFLFSPEPAQPPKLAKGFLYCQPESVAAHAGFHAKIASTILPSELPELTKQASWLDRVRAKAGVYIPVLGLDLKQAPDWAAAAQRYVESASLDQLRRVSTDVLFSKSTATLDQVKAAAQSETVQKTLSDIQNIVGSYLKRSE
ncbi:hypothetical protein [Bradyrhizobium sp. CCGE-LA001]|uniref:hypothetical protein n=1 Tax=Bradyrhizobium sp. CCGE-LA001 TaxID=1223566 RepID=UPI0002AAA98A|nr:hypothetical protein [Bradyrhizobium sp. CCGE-LA001]AMA59952.1 hypothetical protein BCCGELA001_29345 [Bradyrhizobium sp. CCGE-LA001]